MKAIYHPEFEEALRLKALGHYEAAKQLFKQLLETDSNDLNLLMMIGDICYTQENYPDAETYFHRAVMCGPSLEPASLGLFYSLWKQQKQSEALQEMERFREIFPSDNYGIIKQELAELFGNSKSLMTNPVTKEQAYEASKQTWPNK